MADTALILLLGAPATGKSTLAAMLAGHYGWCALSKDRFKEQLFDTLGTGNAHWSRRLSDAGFAMLFAAAAQLLHNSRGPLLLEGNFRPAEHEPQVRRLIAETRSGPLAVGQILCEAAPEIRAARLRGRAADPDRHPGHLDQTLLERSPPVVTPAEGSGFLDIDGLKFRYDSGADAPQRPRLLAALDGWMSC